MLAAVLAFFTIALLARAGPEKLHSLHFGQKKGDLGRPRVVVAAEDKWKVPPNWDPVNPVYADFTP